MLFMYLVTLINKAPSAPIQETSISKRKYIKKLRTALLKKNFDIMRHYTYFLFAIFIVAQSI